MDVVDRVLLDSEGLELLPSFLALSLSLASFVSLADLPAFEQCCALFVSRLLRSHFGKFLAASGMVLGFP